MSGIAAEVLSHPSIKRLKRVAEALGDLAPRVVFIGGSIAPLLQTVPPFDEARPTTDVDGVVATAAYSEINVLHRALRARGFRQPPSESAHVHRALVASRPALVGEVSEAPSVLRDFVGSRSAGLLADPRLRDILAGHLNNAQDPHGTADLVLGRLREIRELTLRE